MCPEAIPRRAGTAHPESVLPKELDEVWHVRRWYLGICLRVEVLGVERHVRPRVVRVFVDTVFACKS